MPEVVNTSALSFGSDQAIEAEGVQLEDDRPTAIKVENVSMVFNMASERLNNLKEYFLKIVKHELFFEELVALDGISFEVKKGDVFGILGTNGSGKSTLLKIVAGVLEPTRGKVEINGAIAPLIELGAGFDMDLSARENIFLNGALLGYSKEFIQEHFDDIVEFAEVEKFLDMPMKNYSSGMVARIAFAIATVMVPEILIVDEVLSVGDFMFQQKCEDRITELIERHGVTVLIVSHSNDQIERLCNKAIWIEKGHPRIMGDATQVCNAYRVLGGRTGSAESEAIVFDAFQSISSDDVACTPFSVIRGENYIDIACRLAREGWSTNSTEYAILVPSFTHAFSLAISGIAGKFDAPVLPYTSDGVPANVLNTLNFLRVKSIIIVCKSCEFAQLSEQIAIHIDAVDSILAPIDYHPDKNAHGLIGFENGLESWNNERIIVTAFSDNDVSFALSPLAYAEQCTFLIIDDHRESPSDSDCHSLSLIGPREVVLAGVAETSRFSEWFENNGYKVTRVNKDNVGGVNAMFSVLNYIAEQECFESASEVIIAPNSKWLDLLCIAPFAAKHGAFLLLIDNTSLDSMANAIKYLRKRKPTKMTFIGESALLEIDRKLLACARF